MSREFKPMYVFHKWNGHAKMLLLLMVAFFAISKENKAQCTKGTTPVTFATGSYDWPNPNNLVVLYVTNDIIIPANATVTIKDLELGFYDDVSITVEKGAKLIIDNGYLTNCNGLVSTGGGSSSTVSTVTQFWQGIIIKGDPGVQQYDASNNSFNNNDFGRVDIKNNSVIEYARIGVEVGDGATNNGGLLRVTNNNENRSCTFRNCKKAVYFHPYQYDNYSFFKCAAFEWTEFLSSTIDNQNYSSPFNFADDPTITALVTLENVKGIYFAGGNIFRNTTPILQYKNASNWDNDHNHYDYKSQSKYRGYAILSLGSSFTTKKTGLWHQYNTGGCTTGWSVGLFNKFENFTIAILCAKNTNTTNTLQVELNITGCRFLNNHMGIYNLDAKTCNIVNNLFLWNNDLYYYSFEIGTSILPIYPLKSSGYCASIESIESNGVQVINTEENNSVYIAHNVFDYELTAHAINYGYIRTFCYPTDLRAIFMANGAPQNSTNSAYNSIDYNIFKFVNRLRDCPERTQAIYLIDDNGKLEIRNNSFSHEIQNPNNDDDNRSSYDLYLSGLETIFGTSSYPLKLLSPQGSLYAYSHGNKWGSNKRGNVNLYCYEYNIFWENPCTPCSLRFMYHDYYPEHAKVNVPLSFDQDYTSFARVISKNYLCLAYNAHNNFIKYINEGESDPKENHIDILQEGTGTTENTTDEIDNYFDETTTTGSGGTESTSPPLPVGNDTNSNTGNIFTQNITNQSSYISITESLILIKQTYSENTSIIISDVLGRIVYNGRVKPNSDKIELKNIIKHGGVYIYTLFANNKPISNGKFFYQTKD